MISINLLSPRQVCASDNRQQQVLRKTRIGRVSRTLEHERLTQLKPPSLSPALQERLLGKSPLRLVCERTQIEKGIWQERLACGHNLTTFLNFEWDDKAHMVLHEPIAARRRCRECKAIADELIEAPPKKPVRSVSLGEVADRKKRA